MPKEFQVGCKVPDQPKKQNAEGQEDVKETTSRKEDNMIKVGKPAPNFTAPAYYNGKFVSVDLEEYRGKWVLLCVYPGDFTFV